MIFTHRMYHRYGKLVVNCGMMTDWRHKIEHVFNLMDILSLKQIIFLIRP